MRANRHTFTCSAAFAVLAAAFLFCPPAGGSESGGGGTAPGAQDAGAVVGFGEATQGALRSKVAGKLVECPLKHTDVKVSISGFLARVAVKQTFVNPSEEKIEAVYVFPLSHQSAVDELVMQVGERRVVGVIKKREEARKLYEKELKEGRTASLLEQQRPNIFTQSVGNIPPKGTVEITIGYTDVLGYDDGTYSFRFPMVVGPRYCPPPVADAERISPPVLKPGFRTGHDIALAVELDAGVPVQGIKVAQHQAKVRKTGPARATVELDQQDSIPNKDFVLTYRVRGEKPEVAVLANRTGDGSGHFLLMIQPKEDPAQSSMPARELVFLVDVSGSMSGQPLAKATEAMAHFLRACQPHDTVQVVTFAGEAVPLFDAPLPANKENIEKALNFTQGLNAGGGTRMLDGVKKALADPPKDDQRMRVVIMLTDGFIGNEAEIISEVGLRCSERIRFWCFGIGSSPNEFLLDGVAARGGGLAKRIGLSDPAGPVVDEAMARIQHAQLSKIRIDWNGVNVSGLLPGRIPDLWSGQPVVLFGQYAGGGPEAAELTVRGDAEGTELVWTVKAAFPKRSEAHAVLAPTWARQRIREWAVHMDPLKYTEYRENVTELALQYSLMSEFTSLVAMEEHAEPAAGDGQPPKKVLVPVPLPDGTSFEGIFGNDIPLGGAGSVGAIGVGGGGGYGGRRRLVRHGGGSKATESQVDGALDWLAKHQEAGGCWNVQRAEGKVEPDVQGTAQALLAFTGAGHTEKVGRFKDNVRRAVAWMVQHQDKDGKLGGEDLPTHAWAALAVSEAAAMSRMPITKKSAQAAIEWTAKRLEAVETLEMEPLMLVAMQLKSAKLAGLSVEAASFEKVTKLLEKLAAASKDPAAKGPVLYRERIGETDPDPAATAKACTIRMLLGKPLEDWKDAAEWFLKQKGAPAWPKDNERADMMYWFAGSIALFQTGGEVWNTWNTALKPALVSNALKEGDDSGSWDPKASRDPVPSRARATALCALCLEVYYRYLPLYR